MVLFISAQTRVIDAQRYGKDGIAEILGIHGWNPHPITPHDRAAERQHPSHRRHIRTVFVLFRLANAENLSGER